MVPFRLSLRLRFLPEISVKNIAEFSINTHKDVHGKEVNGCKLNLKVFIHLNLSWLVSFTFHFSC